MICSPVKGERYQWLLARVMGGKWRYFIPDPRSQSEIFDNLNSPPLTGGVGEGEGYCFFTFPASFVIFTFAPSSFVRSSTASRNSAP